MIPIGPIVAAAVVAARAAGNGGQRRVAAPRGPFRWAGKVWGVAIFIQIALLIAFADDGPAKGFLWGAWLLLFLFPWPIARRVLVPLGLARTAYCLTLLSDVVWKIDRRGGAAIAGAMALLRSGTPSVRAIEWLERRLAKAKMLKGAGVCATGLLQAARGNLDGARAILESVDMIDARACPTPARLFAAEWLACDAAARGAWPEVRALGNAIAPRTRATRFLAVCAERLLGVDDRDGGHPGGVRDAGLIVCWLRAGERLETWPLLRRALATPRTREPRPLPSEPAPTGDRMRDALGLHARVLRRPKEARSVEELTRLGRAWDLALGDATLRRQAAERALTLGASTGEQALAKLAFAVEDDLVAMARASALPISDVAASETLDRAARRLRDQLLSEIELASAAMRTRAADQKALPAVDEWREWIHVKQLCERAFKLGGLELRRLAFPTVHPDVCKLAVWLWNVRHERPIANAIFTWLYAEAQAVGDAQAIELERKNVACGVA